jgi:hypothetical protein
VRAGGRDGPQRGMKSGRRREESAAAVGPEEADQPHSRNSSS